MEERLKEILARKAEIRKLLESDEDVNLDEIKTELDALETEEKALNEKAEAEEKKEEQEAEERKAVAEKIKSGEIKPTERKEEMEKKYTLASPEYRSAWAKTLMGIKLTDEEERALGDAVTTTATTYVAATAQVSGINNGGLYIPTSVREDLMKLIELQSPFYADCTKLGVAGDIDLPYLASADDAEWYVEGTDTKNEGQEHKNIHLTGWELAKDIVVTWKVEAMAIDSFINYLLAEASQKMGKAICNAALYGTGTNQPTGATVGLTAVTTGDDPFERIKNVKATLTEENLVGAKAYISPAVADDITFYKDENGNYPYLAGLPRIANLPVEVDPFLKNKDILIGNPKMYVMNFQIPVRFDRESTVKGRKTTYGAYTIADGKAKAACFALGSVASL